MGGSQAVGIPHHDCHVTDLAHSHISCRAIESAFSGCRDQGMRNYSFDGARGIAAMWVALGHCCTAITGVAIYHSTVSDFSQMQAWEIVARLWHSVFPADSAVLLFFVLSGHVLSEALRSKKDPSSEFAPYVIRRFFRLVPVSLAAAVPLYFLLPSELVDIIKAALFLDIGLNGVIWSLQVEVIGSLLVFVLWAVRSNFCAVFAAALSLLAYYYSSSYIFLFQPAFVLGYFVSQANWRVLNSRWVLAAAVIALMFTDLFLGKAMLSKTIESGAAFLIVAHLRLRPLHLLEHGPSRFLGDISYPFYLCHLIGVLLFNRYFSELAAGKPPMTSVAIMAAVSITIAIVVAWAIHKFVELPGIKLGNRAVKLRSLPVNQFARPQEGA